MPAAAAASSNEDAADIIAMAAASKAQSKPTASASASTGSNNSSNTDALARSNLLRLETCELLKESILHIHPTTISNSLGDGSGGVRAHEEAKWAPSVRDYLDKITQVITSLDETTLSPSVALLPNSNSAGTSGKDAATSPEYRIPLLSDKFHKSLLPITSGKEKSVADHRDNPLTTWSFPFHGGPSLSLVPIGSFGHLGNAGLANRHANGGNVVPVLDVAVLVDNTHNVASPFVGGKDYLNHRYTDKRNILAVHIAKQLSQKKFRNKIGAVHLTHVFGDSRKVGLLLTPPRLDAEDGDDDKKKGKNKRKRNEVEQSKSNSGSSGKGGGGKKNKLRFRIRLIFGIKQASEQKQGAHHTSEDHYSTDDDDDEVNLATTSTKWNHWIPRSRLLPDRSNNRSKELEDHHRHHNRQHGKNSVANATTPPNSSTPHYTNSLAEDLHLQSTTHLINATLATLSSTSSSVTSNDSASTPTSPFHETLLLLKVWALQRGFLRGHDTFTTTTLAVLLVYLYRTKAIGKRMGCVQAFTTFMKFWSENDWLGEDTSTSSSSSSSTSARTTAAAVGVGSLSNPSAVHERKAKKKSALVIPDMGRTESQTVAHCAQARCYLDDIRGGSNNTDHADGSSSGASPPPKTLLDCYRVNYTSSSSFSSSVDNDCHHDSPILLDPSMTLNYLARLSPSFVRESRAEAYMALRYIHGLDVDGKEGGGGWAFRKLFLETNRFWTRYDAYVRVQLSAVPRIIGLANTSLIGTSGVNKRKHHGQGHATSQKRVWGNDVDDIGYEESVCRSVVEVLARALGDRITSIRAFTSGNGNIRASVSPLDETDEHVATNIIADSDQCHVIPIRGSTSHTLGYSARTGDRSPMSPALQLSDDMNESCLVVGLRIDPNNSRRIVDRGPPAEDVLGSNAFVTLWGEQHAQLRRFQDGAIVRAVVWNNTPSSTESAQFSGMDRSMGGIVERIVQHIVNLHFTDGKLVKAKRDVTFQLRNMISLIDGVSSPQSSPFSDSLALHKNIMTAFDSLADFLRQNSRTATEHALGKKASTLGLPLAIDTVEPLSPCLRYSELFPPVPHPLLGGVSADVLGSDKRKVSGVNVGSPILIQIRFEGSSKWPTSLNAMGAAKCAMLLQLADGIEKMKQERGNVAEYDLNSFDGPIDVTPTYLDVGYRGYSWRIIVRADEELRMLRTLRSPTAEASALRLSLINRHVRGAMHHSLIHAVHTRHPSASSVVRLAHRWLASHMMSDMISHEAIELIVAKIYTESTGKSTALVNTPPSTAVAGFIRFLNLISTHDWVREPLIVDPQNHITANDRALIRAQFSNVRGPEWSRGPAMYIISPTDYDTVEDMEGSKVVGEEVSAMQTIPSANATEKHWAPSATSNSFPEKVVLTRAAALAKCSHDHLIACIMRGNTGNSWIAAFQESSQSLSSFSALLRVRSCFITDSGCSSTNADSSILCARSKPDQLLVPFERSLRNRFAGPNELRKKLYKNLVLERDTIHEWDPVRSLVGTLRSKYNQYAVFFYNEFAPEVIAMVWRPDAFKPRPFSVGASNLTRPVAEFWKDDSFIITNTEELMAEVGYLARDVVSNLKVFDDKKPHDAIEITKRTRTADDEE